MPRTGSGERSELRASFIFGGGGNEQKIYFEFTLYVPKHLLRCTQFGAAHFVVHVLHKVNLRRTKHKLCLRKRNYNGQAVNDFHSFCAVSRPLESFVIARQNVYGDNASEGVSE